MIWVGWLISLFLAFIIGWICRELMPRDDQIDQEYPIVGEPDSPALENQGENMVLLSDAEIAALEQDFLRKKR